jgi:hypothetical protein
VLTIGLAFALLVLRRTNPAVRDVSLLALAQALFWFFNAQVSRYLISILPLLSVGAGYAAWRLATDAPGARIGRYGVPALLALQCGTLFWGVLALPARVRNVPESARGLPTAVTPLSIPDALDILASPGGGERMLSQRLDVYDACRWVNRSTPRDAKLVLYDETRGFYLDREYMWGNGEHSAYIPYSRMRSGQDLTAWMLAHGVRYALINMNNWQGASAPAPGSATGDIERLRTAYVEHSPSPGSWRWVLGDALRSGWTPVFAAHGVVVLEGRGS